MCKESKLLGQTLGALGPALGNVVLTQVSFLTSWGSFPCWLWWPHNQGHSQVTVCAAQVDSIGNFCLCLTWCLMTGQKGRVHSPFACSLVFIGWNVPGARDHGDSKPVLLRESQCVCSEETNFLYQRKLIPKSWWLSWQGWGEGVGEWELHFHTSTGRRKQGNAPKPASRMLN